MSTFRGPRASGRGGFFRWWGFSTILSRKILAESGSAMAVTWACLVFIMATGSALKLLNPEKGVTLASLGLFLPALVLHSLPYTIPTALICGVAVTFGRMAQDNELVAIRASGIPVIRLVQPLLFTALLLCGFLAWLNAEAVPHAVGERTKLIEQAARDRFATLPTKAHTVTFLNDVQFSYQSRHGERFDGVTAFLYSKRLAPTYMLLAESLILPGFPSLDAGSLIVRNGKAIKLSETGVPLEIVTITGQRRLADLDDLRLSPSSPHRLGADSSANLKRRLKAGEFERSRDRHKAAAEIAKREALALAPLIFVLLGVPLGLRFRHENRLITAGKVVVPVILIYYTLLLFSNHLAVELGWHARMCYLLPMLGLGLFALRTFLRTAKY